MLAVIFGAVLIIIGLLFAFIGGYAIMTEMSEEIDHE